MSSAFVTIQAGLQAALAAAPALAGGQLQVNKLRPIAESQTTALVLRLDRTLGQEGVIGTIDWVSDYSIECYARNASGAEPAGAVDALLLDVWARVAAIDAASIGASQITLTPQIDWQYDVAATPMVGAVVHLTVSHSTTTTSLIASA